MTGDDFVQFAQFLAALRRNEACCRSAISRAYYGAFHVARSFLGEMGLAAGPRHDMLADDFREAQLDDAVLVGRLLDELRTRRLDADYELGKTYVGRPEFAAYIVERAQELVACLASLRRQIEQDTVKQQLLSTIKQARAARRP